MENRRFGYILVSSRDQNEGGGGQLQLMQEVEISYCDNFIDKQSEKNFNREWYQLLKRMIREGDIFYIHSLVLLWS